MMEKMILKKKVFDSPNDEVLGLEIIHKFFEETMEKDNGVWKSGFPYDGEDVEEVKATIEGELSGDSGLGNAKVGLRIAGDTVNVSIDYEFNIEGDEGEGSSFQDPYIETWHEIK